MRLRPYAIMLALLGAVCAVVLLAGCESDSLALFDASQVTLVTRTPLRPSATPPARGAGSPAVTPASDQEIPVAAQDPCQAAQPSRTRHDIRAVLNWATYRLQVEQHITYANDTGYRQAALVFYVETNREPDQFLLRRVTMVDGRALRGYILDGTRLTVPLRTGLAPGCAVELVLEYDLMIPPIQDGYRAGHLGYWGYSPRQVNLGMWFPVLAVYDPALDWVTPHAYSIGEQSILLASDFEVDLILKNAPDGVQAAGPGTITWDGKRTWHFTLEAGRELALSLSDQFHSLTTSTPGGVQVELYYLADSTTATLDAPRHALQTAADALSLYQELYGAYPYTRLVVVQGDFPDGMEFSGLVFVSEAWFRTWHGIPNDWLTLITAHEVAHQWWYALVGSNQGQYPYMDEALAIYSEVLFLERYYPQLVAWWWDFRVMSYTPTGYVDSTVYDFHSVRGYIDAVYLRGALMMDALRRDLGDEAFFDWLRRYARQMQGRVATPPDFWGLLSADAYQMTQTTRQAYLRQVDVLPQSAEIP